MRRSLIQLFIAVGLATGAFLSSNTAARTRADIAAEERRLTLQENSDYWSGRYDAVSQVTSARESESLLLAANAAFRKAQRDGAGAPSVARLDQVLQAYASVLKNGGVNHDAAYNFEFVARLRDQVAKSARRARPGPQEGANMPDDLPAGPTIHGQPGAHPPDTRGEEFEVITPMDYGEREARPEPTPGRPLPRKG